jgi:hypothetical protein
VPELIAADFLVALPFSLLSWVVLVRSMGFLSDPRDQPASFRLFGLPVAEFKSDRPVFPGIVAGLLGLGLANFVPLVVLAVGAWGLPGISIGLLYVALQGIWLSRVWRAIARARSRDQAGSGR